MRLQTGLPRNAPAPAVAPDTGLLCRLEKEWAALQGLASPAAALALACRAAATAATTEPAGERARAAEAVATLEPFAADAPDPGLLPVHLSRAAALLNRAPPALEDRALDEILRAWPLSISPESFIIAGGDDRLALDPATGRNRYGCAPRPDPELIQFASCTASTIGERGFAAIETARMSMLRETLSGRFENQYLVGAFMSGGHSISSQTNSSSGWPWAWP